MPEDLTPVLSSAYALGVTGVIFGKHIDKGTADLAKGIYTLPVILGDTASRLVASLLLLAQYAMVAALAYVALLPSWTLLSLLAYPSYVDAAALFASPKPAEREYVPAAALRKVWPNYFAAIAFRHNALFGLLFVTGLFVHGITQ